MTKDQTVYLNRHRIREAMPHVGIPAHYASDDSCGFNGCFRFPWKDKMLRVVASNGMGWEHVSVSVERLSKTPSWEIMCHIKSLFWEPEQAVIQYHPPESCYVNFHPHCLHLWRPLDWELKVPDAILVGPTKKVVATTV